MSENGRNGRGTRRIAVLCWIAVLAAGLNGCGGGGSHGYSELLFVSDRLTISTYSVSAGVPTLRGTTMIPGIPGTYSRTGNLVTITMQKHNVPDGYKVQLDFFAGVGGTATDGIYVVTVVDDDTFTIDDPAAGTITDGTVLRSPSVLLGATYSQAGNVVTITLPGHGLSDQDTVILDYTSGGAVDDDVEIDTIVDADNFTVLADAPLTTTGDVNVTVGGNYTIFGFAMHPSGQWLYVTSQYDCYNGDPYCWGGDLISRFAINWGNGTLTFEESYRTSDDSAVAVPEPSPVTLVFSPDGLHLFHQDDDLDGLRMWDCDPVSGALTLVANSGQGTTGQHGIAVAADGSRVYHGTRVYTVGAASLTLIPGGEVGEANQILGDTMFAIIGGGNNAQLQSFSLTDPDLPVLIAASADTPNRARDFVLAQGGALIVESGFGGLKSYTYDGANIVPAVSVGNTELSDGGLPFPANGVLARVYRTISLNAAEDLVAAAYFTNDPDAGTGGVPPSGFILANVAADGALTLAGDFETSYYARVARFYQKP
jgi:6-phosphogluconolactonase (cycloisomerase 2 family)